MNNESTLKNGTVVNVHINDNMEILGKIVGIASYEVIGFGKTYIVESIGSKLPNVTYPYKVFTAFNSQITVVKDSNNCG